MERAYGEAYFEAYEDKIVINDPVWGRCEIGDQPGDEIYFDLLDNPMVRRTMAIEQLSSDRTTATIPGTSDFPRWEHVWGSLVFARKMMAGSSLSPREQRTLELRTFVSDLGTTAYSHLGDMIFQDGNSEDLHDMELPELMEKTGICDILRRHGYDPADIIFPPKVDWIERPSPDLCVDRVDYAAREIKRWLAEAIMPWPDVVRPTGYRVIDDQLVMSSQDEALAFAKAYMMLSTEHWGEPVHRLILKLQEQQIKSVLAREYTEFLTTDPFDVGSYHPRLLLYAADADISREISRRAPHNSIIHGMIQDVAASKRRIFTSMRCGELNGFLWDKATVDYPDPIQHYGKEGMFKGRIAPLVPPNVAIVPVETTNDVEGYGEQPHNIDIFLPPLKARQIDPLFLNPDGEVVRLSEANSQYAELMQKQNRQMRQAYVGRIALQPEVATTIRGEIAKTDREWQEALQRPVMPDEVFLRTLHHGVAVAAGYSMIDMKWQR